SYLLSTWEKGKIRIAGVSGQVEHINQMKQNTEIIMGNKIIKIKQLYAYNKIHCDILLGNDFIQQFEYYQQKATIVSFKTL
ncbi:hypothetical protein, partial [Klebsiella pneumoniae]|uniref:hypothetical protein n=1 Tax=Klebsiella pneumoniae TaxID=573 RepID=UPI001D0EC715